MATAMVLFMTVPALALFYGGMTRARSVLNMMMMSYAAVAVVGLVYVLWGWSMAFGSKDVGGFFASPFELFGLDGVEGGDYIYVAFQMTFAIITAALISGAIADRVKFSAWLVFLPLWVTFSYFPIAHMVWTDTGFIHEHFPAQDYAGGTVVHINAGLAGGILALIIGKRIGWPREQMRPHNLPLTMMGAALLWFGWYGFNVGSIVFPKDASDADKTAQFMTETGITFMNTTVATMAAILAWLLVEKLLHGKATSLGAASGIVAGLVAITPAAGAVSIVGAIAIGAISGALCAWAVGLKFKWGLDDSLDVVGVHLVGGLVGTLLIGFLSTSSAPGGIDGLFYGGGFDSLIDQTMAVVIAVVWTGVFTTLIALGIARTIGWRVEDEDEVTNGIDFAEHGESAYDIAGSSGTIL
ncbi:ammonium transporter [Aeromicrobium duanguangcaii]|uniref:ammonium transporter n=1 Tax=Aeromicrobium duanguangcaii TaxID=2968086 RepID=UPI0024B51981|nr:ammonium transporter [Aeromicrobium duanguangcaii]